MVTNCDECDVNPQENALAEVHQEAFEHGAGI